MLLTLKIINRRNDGLTVDVTRLDDGSLNVTLLNDKGQIVDDDNNRPEAFYEWVETRKDY